MSRSSDLADAAAERALYVSQPDASLLLSVAQELRRLERAAETALVVKEGSGIVAVCSKCDERSVAKRCSKCRKHKPLDDFPKSARHSHGRSCYCRDCWKTIKREGRERRAQQTA